MDGLYDGKTVLLVYLYCIFWFLATEVFKTITYVIWEKIQFHDDAHFKQFFIVTGWTKKDKNQPLLVDSSAVEMKEMKEQNDLK